MDYLSITKELLEFTDKSYSTFHAVKELSEILLSSGFVELYENSMWELNEGGKYFLIRNQSSLIAFTYPKKEFKGFNIVASHSDSPSFKLKEIFDIKVASAYTKLNVEKYGGMIMSSWFDRALSVAGRVVVKTDDGIKSNLLNIDKDLMLIPNVAIHMQREINEGKSYNAQVDTLPLLGDDKSDLKKLIADELNVNKEDILSHDLFLYVREKGKIVGGSNEYVMSPKLDDLQCAFASVKAIIQSENDSVVDVVFVADNEEVGSRTKQGAFSPFLADTLSRISKLSNKDSQQHDIALSNSFLISADNAHAVHPNHQGKTDETNFNYINKGPVIKFNASQSYCTDAISASVFKKLCRNAAVPFQVFHNRSDVQGGGTLGNCSTTQVAINSVDIGLPQFAMHSAVETAGTKDTLYAINVMKEFYNTEFSINSGDVKMSNKNMKFVIASHNKHKIAEFQRILSPLGIEVITADITEAEENGKTFFENSLLKSRLACEETGLPSIADDSGLCVDALGGEPGIYSARYAPEGKRKATVLEKLKGETNRKAQFVCAISCVFPNGDVIEVQENCEGEISQTVVGDSGFGYDPIFMCGDKSFAQMSGEEKDAVSHRGKALREFKKKLEEYLEK